ncbi:hypothetical protein [Zhaonella formicivorans]|uniref:hypothetical protein n=1 Tax=Zhaonella formicivorans TaxID=2528593 RepID=UPI0010EF2887|nr:hypothetical protein [Zhaonella formicivorans]
MSTKARLVILGLVAAIAVFVVYVSFSSTAQESLHQRYSDYQGALAEAKAEKVPAFVEFYSET